MVSSDVYLAYVATVLVFFAHPPGPGQLLFMAHSTRRGVRRALPVIVGNHGANIIQMTLAGFGLVGAVAASAEVFLTLKWLGVGYLLMLGVGMMRGRPSRVRHAPGAEHAGSLVRQGFLTAAANPYAVMFFAALFPQFLDTRVALAPQIAILGATYLVIDGVILLAMGASAARILKAVGASAMTTLNRISGALMIAAAVLLAFRGVAPEKR